MDKKQFQDAFSVVRASDTLRMEVMQMTAKPKHTRLLPKLLLAAVIVSLLTTTAFAAAAILDALKGGEVKQEGGQWYAPTGSPYDQGPYHYYELYLYIELHPDAPQTIETFYMPVLEESYVSYLGEKLNGAAQFGWTNGLHNWEDEILFYQFAGGKFDPEKPIDGLFTPAGQVAQTKVVQLGNVTGFLAEDTLYRGRRHFYWSDGDYVFHLAVPDEYTDQQLEALVASVRQVPSIEPYLVDNQIDNQTLSGEKG